MKMPPARMAAYAAGALVLALVFLAYLRPEFLMDLGNRIAMCF
jgi:hypothetical protein